MSCIRQTEEPILIPTYALLSSALISQLLHLHLNDVKRNIHNRTADNILNPSELSTSILQLRRHSRLNIDKDPNYSIRSPQQQHPKIDRTKHQSRRKLAAIEWMRQLTALPYPRENPRYDLSFTIIASLPDS